MAHLVIYSFLQCMCVRYHEEKHVVGRVKGPTPKVAARQNLEQPVSSEEAFEMPQFHTRRLH